MNDAHHFLDNNVVSHLSKPQRESEFLCQYCHIPSEVLREAGSRHLQVLRKVEYPTTPHVLEALREVMATVHVGDTRLVDLYANKGSADPLLVACALVETRRAELQLFAPQWIVVSDDNAVRATARVLGVEALSRDEFFSATATAWDD